MGRCCPGGAVRAPNAPPISAGVLFFMALLSASALYLNNLLERDECSKDDLEVCSNPAIPSIFTEACTNGSYVEVGFGPVLAGKPLGNRWETAGKLLGNRWEGASCSPAALMNAKH